MTYFILAEIATLSYEGEVNDVNYDIMQVEAGDETSAKEALRLMIKNQGGRVGRMFVEAHCTADLSDSLY